MHIILHLQMPEGYLITLGKSFYKVELAVTFSYHEVQPLAVEAILIVLTCIRNKLKTLDLLVIIKKITKLVIFFI